jgi:hypothetical protein
MWDCIKECMSKMLIGVSVWTVIVIIGVIVAGLTATAATGGAAAGLTIALVKLALAKGGIALLTSGLASLAGCIGGCRVAVP